MGRKKRKQQKGVENDAYSIWCYYCDRIFSDEATLILHQKAKHFKCESCGKKLSGVSGLVIHAQQVHKINMSLVPNAKPGRDSVQKEVFGMAGVPVGMKPGGEIDEQAAKRAKLEAQQQVPTTSLPQPPFSVGPPFGPTMPPQPIPPNPGPFLAFPSAVPPGAAPPLGFPPPYHQPPNPFAAPPPGFVPPPMLPSQPFPLGFPPPGIPPFPPPPGALPPPPAASPPLDQPNIQQTTNSILIAPQLPPSGPLFPVSQTSTEGVSQKAVSTQDTGLQQVVQDKLMWSEENVSPEEKRALGTLYRSFFKDPPTIGQHAENSS